MLRVSTKNERRFAAPTKNLRREASRLYKKPETLCGADNELDKTDFQAKVEANKNFCLKRWIEATTRDCPFAVKYLFICASVLNILEKRHYSI